MTIKTNSSKAPTNQETLPKGLLQDLRSMIDQTRSSIASTINARLTMLYWNLGVRIRKEILNDERAEYGQKIVATVSRQLTREYGKGFLEKNLRRMIQFAVIFIDKEIVVSLIRQLSWTYFMTFIPNALSNESLQISYNWSHYDCKRR